MYIDNFIENYSWLFKNMPNKTKIELIGWLSNSILEEKTPKKITKEDFFDLFGSWDSEKSGDEIVEEIYNTRKDAPRIVEL